ncbi:MAG: hypothetical protein KAS32_28165 [Candidatus Peribacteraceae bacterium]|nr:hypothetical protein [Candidatus Peribacteraceae bacterium]
MRALSTLLCTIAIWGAVACILIYSPTVKDQFLIFLIVCIAASANVGIASANEEQVTINCPYHDDELDEDIDYGHEDDHEEDVLL